MGKTIKRWKEIQVIELEHMLETIALNENRR